jgi:phage-related protein (TIGR01555 family)
MPGRDASLHTRMGRVPEILNDVELRRLHRFDWLIGKIVDTQARDMTRKGFQLHITDGDEADIKRVLKIYNHRLKAKAKMRSARRWELLMGGAAIVAKTNGSNETEEPLDLKKLQTLDRLMVFDRYQIEPDYAEWNLLEPEYYRIIRSTDLRDSKGESLKYGQKIHHSRVLKFAGIELSADDMANNRGWGDPIVHRIKDVLARYRTASSTILKAIESFSVLNISVQEMHKLVGAGKIEEVKKYLQEVSMALSLFGVLLTDSTTSSADFKGRGLGGVEELFTNVFKEELTAASGMPFYKIWEMVGRTGLSDDGGAESKSYADKVLAWQDEAFYSHDTTLLSWIMKSELGYVPDEWDISYNSLYEETLKEKTEIAKARIESYAIAKNAGFIAFEEGRNALAHDELIPLAGAIELDKYLLEGEEDKVAGLLPESEDESAEEEEEEEALEGEIVNDSVRVDDSTPAKRILQWQGYKIGVQFHPWQKRHGRVLSCGYGWLANTRGADGMAVDCYIGFNLESGRIFEITQLVNGQFDELKMAIGFDSAQSALNAYLQAMPESFFGGIREITLEELAKYRVSQETKADESEIKADEAIETTGDVLSEDEFDRLGEVDILKALSNILE